MQKILKIHTDGGSRGNPGIAGVGIFVTDQAGQVLYEQATFLGEKTNNESEYTGFLLSAQWLVNTFLPEEKKSFQPDKIEWYLDSKLVVEQLNKRWKIKEDRLLELAQQCWKALEALPYPFEITHVPRAKNAEADKLANQAMDAAAN